MDKILFFSFKKSKTTVIYSSPCLQNERQKKRVNYSTGELQAFYGAMLPRLEEILSHVDKFPLNELPADSFRLFTLAMSMAEIAPHIELYKGDPKVPHSFDESRFVAEHGDVRG